MYARYECITLLICETFMKERFHDPLFLENVVPAMSPYVTRKCQVLGTGRPCEAQIVLWKSLLKFTDIIVEWWKFVEKYY